MSTNNSEHPRGNETPTMPSALAGDLKVIRLSINAMLEHANSRHPDIDRNIIAAHVSRQVRDTIVGHNFARGLCDRFDDYTPTEPLAPVMPIPLTRKMDENGSLLSIEVIDSGIKTLAELGDTRVLQLKSDEPVSDDQLPTPFMPPVTSWNADYWTEGTPTLPRATSSNDKNGKKFAAFHPLGFYLEPLKNGRK